MQLESLRLQAFGPYVDEQYIDFRQLSSHLFLIRGETGAGKTVILDAITYALYGKSSGGDREDIEMMRCRYAKQEVITFVELIFCIHEHRYRYYREVSVKHKRNGDSAYKVYHDGGELIQDEYYPFFENPKIRALEEKSEALIGLNHAQFSQVMMLPQGKFEQFLVSKSEEKQAILKTLFQMEKWEQISVNLTERLKKEKEAMERDIERLHLHLAQCDVPNLEELQDNIIKLQQEQVQLQEQIVVAEQQLQKQLVEWQEQKQLAQQIAETKRLAKQISADEQLQEHMQHLQEQIKKQDAYAAWLPYIEQYHKAQQTMHLRQEQVQRYQQAWEENQVAKSICEQEQMQIPQWNDEVFQLERECQSLEASRFHYEQHAILQQTDSEQKALYQQQQQAIVVLQAEIEKDVAIYQDLQKQMDDMEQQLLAYPQVVEQLSLYQQGYQLHQEISQEEQLLKQQQQRFVQQQKEILLLQQDATSKQVQHDALYAMYLQESSEALASLLKAGEACPVCGSLDHPSIAHLHQQRLDIISLQGVKEAMDQAQATLQKAQLGMDTLASEIQQIQKQVTQKQTQLDQLLPMGYDHPIHQRLVADKQRANEAMDRKEAIQKQLELQQVQMNGQQVKLQEDLQLHQQSGQHIAIIETKLAASKAYLLASISTLQELDEYIQKQHSIWSTKKAMIANVEERYQHLVITQTSLQSEWDSAKREYADCQEHLHQVKQAYETHRGEGIDDTWVAISMNELASMKQQVEAYRVRKEVTKLQYDALKEQIQGKQAQDIVQLEQAYEQQQLLVNTSIQRHGEHKAVYQQLQEHVKQIKRLQNVIEVAQVRYVEHSEFVKAMRGDNGIGIERYVLGSMLSSITQQANLLLKQVHDGRYQLYRSDMASGRTRKFGLELHIYDAYSCSYRSVVSLSGGEKFLVSLALSLALSTVLQARSGGIRLDTMFIDEGFGSLDEQSIADALQVLSSMFSKTTCIGIISHVELLKENIPYGIHVYKHRNGSHIKMLI